MAASLPSSSSVFKSFCCCRVDDKDSDFDVFAAITDTSDSLDSSIKLDYVRLKLNRGSF